MSCIFKRIEIYTRISGGTLITWELQPGTVLPVGTTYTVFASRSGVGDWVAVGQVVDGNSVEDPNRGLYGKGPALFYKIYVSAITKSYESPVKQAQGNLDDKDYAIIREMIRKEVVRFKGIGFCGFLYKRRYWGTRCTSCTDYDTGEVVNSKCTVCYGTGIVGGYFNPVEYWIAESEGGSARRKVTADTAGIVDQQITAARGLNCPWLDTLDVWVQFETDLRYYVHSVNDLAYRGVVFVFDPIELRLAPTTDIIYSLPRPDDPVVSSSSGSSISG